MCIVEAGQALLARAQVAALADPESKSESKGDSKSDAKSEAIKNEESKNETAKPSDSKEGQQSAGVL
jgi:hypothetical protein